MADYTDEFNGNFSMFWYVLTMQLTIEFMEGLCVCVCVCGQCTLRFNCHRTNRKSRQPLGMNLGTEHFAGFLSIKNKSSYSQSAMETYTLIQNSICPVFGHDIHSDAFGRPNSNGRNGTFPDTKYVHFISVFILINVFYRCSMFALIIHLDSKWGFFGYRRHSKINSRTIKSSHRLIPLLVQCNSTLSLSLWMEFSTLGRLTIVVVVVFHLVALSTEFSIFRATIYPPLNS